MIRAIAWRGLDEWRAEVAELELTSDGARARGTQLGSQPYRAQYALDAASGWVTRSLRVAVAGRHLLLEHDGVGRWTVDGRGRADLDGALDCDLAFSPVTNLLPVRRQRLHERSGASDLAMAWVSLPDLAVHRSEQRYEHVAVGMVHFTELASGFTADLELDADGLVVRYPGLAERV